MLKLDVIDTGIVALQIPAHLGRAVVADLERALCLLSEGGCRGAILELGQMSDVSGDALRRLVDASRRTLDTPMRLVFVAAGNPLARRILESAELHGFSVYKTQAEAAAALALHRASGGRSRGSARKWHKRPRPVSSVGHRT